MKKIIIILSIIIILFSINKKVYQKDETIRFRIIANSDSIEDQQIKKEILKNISAELLNSNSADINEERQYIKEKLPSFEKIVKKTTPKYSIKFGYNYFPKKVYKGITYKEGDYESLVITLGEGAGKNFWCILFPPLCMLDEEEEKVEYKSIIKDVIKKYF